MGHGKVDKVARRVMAWVGSGKAAEEARGNSKYEVIIRSFNNPDYSRQLWSNPSPIPATNTLDTENYAKPFLGLYM